MRGCVSSYVGGYGSITIAVVYTNISGCVPPNHQMQAILAVGVGILAVGVGTFVNPHRQNLSDVFINISIMAPLILKINRSSI